MTETDPGRHDREQTEAGTAGSRRREVGTPVPADERGSLNLPPNDPGLASTGSADATGPGDAGTPSDDLGIPREQRDGTSRPTGVPAGMTVEEAVRRDIEETRRELGDTVEALVHKTDVRSRVQHTAASMGDQLKERVQHTAANVGDDLKRMGTATTATATGLVDRVKGAAPEMMDKVRDATPTEVRNAAGRVSAEAGKRPVATMAVAGALALLVVRVMRRRRMRGTADDSGSFFWMVRSAARNPRAALDPRPAFRIRKVR
ncbi:hypothetical protein GCM10010156_31380 [Planobispora rosea]|uniref:DUF3618 domain-containing protein n=1 Tax=Planobispora rosea TaxID=35762 RepID=A0A8J3RUE7_PLARO|nr:DUF3618 domain-containing protein [Planobispora rosea]GGS70275.1 hypothetical protein GCM10010156_31380 [Planobispora rosea]GIH83246.1 hypothetical protein Pro02_16540 [Planobispora rosea]